MQDCGNLNIPKSSQGIVIVIEVIIAYTAQEVNMSLDLKKTCMYCYAAHRSYKRVF
jgi:hypothetical protein